MSEENARANSESVFGAFRTAFHELGKAIAPPESVDSHFREARKQILLGLREIIDLRIQNMSQAGNKGTHVPVD